MYAQGDVLGERWRILSVLTTGPRGQQCEVEDDDGVAGVAWACTAPGPARAAFRRAAQAARNITHPAVPRVFDTGDDWVVLSRPPEDRADDPTDPARAAALGVAVADALAALHRVGIRFRGLLDDDVRLDATGEVVLAAPLPTQDLEADAIRRRAPPEAERSPVAADPVAWDVYAVGAWLAERVGGGWTASDDRVARKEQGPVPLPEGVPASLAQALREATAPQPADRPTSMAMLRARLAGAVPRDAQDVVEVPPDAAEGPPSTGPGPTDVPAPDVDGVEPDAWLDDEDDDVVVVVQRAGVPWWLVGLAVVLVLVVAWVWMGPDDDGAAASASDPPAAPQAEAPAPPPAAPVERADAEVAPDEAVVAETDAAPAADTDAAPAADTDAARADDPEQGAEAAPGGAGLGAAAIEGADGTPAEDGTPQAAPATTDDGAAADPVTPAPARSAASAASAPAADAATPSTPSETPDETPDPTEASAPAAAPDPAGASDAAVAPAASVWEATPQDEEPAAPSGEDRLTAILAASPTDALAAASASPAEAGATVDALAVRSWDAEVVAKARRAYAHLVAGMNANVGYGIRFLRAAATSGRLEVLLVLPRGGTPLSLPRPVLDALAELAPEAVRAPDSVADCERLVRFMVHLGGAGLEGRHPWIAQACGACVEIGGPVGRCATE